MSEATSGDRSRAAWYAVVLVLWLLLAGLYGFAAVTGRSPPWDAAALFAPYFTLLADYARAGEWLLWNPWSNCGSPDVAEVEFGSFSPPTLAIALLTGGGRLGFLLYWIAIWGFGAAGCVLLGRHLRTSPMATLAVTIPFVFGGVYFGTASFTSWLYTFSFLPWLVWRFDEALRSRRMGPALEAGALYGLSALAGHPAIVILNGLYLACWALGRVATGAERPARLAAAGFATACLTLVVVVGSAVLAPAYVAFFAEGAGYSDRVGALPRATAVGEHALAPGAVATLASPYLSALVLDNLELWDESFVSLTYCYVGASIPTLALLTLLSPVADRRRARWHRWLFIVCGLLWLAAAVGPALPLRGWLYDLVPPTRYFRHTAIFRVYFLFTLMILAFAGTGVLAGEGRRAARRMLAIGAVGSALAASAFAVVLTMVAAPGPRLGLGMAHLAAAWGGVGLVALIGWRGSERWAQRLPALLVALAVVDAALTTVLSARLVLRLPAKDEPAHRPELDLSLARTRYSIDSLMPLNLHLNVKVPVLESYNQLNHRFHSTQSKYALPTSWSKEPLLAELAIGRDGRTWFAPAAAEVSPSDGAFRAFVVAARRRGEVPLVVHRRPAMLAAPAPGEAGEEDERLEAVIAELPPLEPIPVELERYTPRQLTIVVDCPRAGWVLVTDRWARGWRARVDGLETDIAGGNFLFRAFELGAGRHRIELTYEPAGFPGLVIVSWGALALIALWSIRRVAHSRRR